MITSDMIQSEVTSEYSDRPSEERAAAENAYSIGLDWVNNQPKTWCQVDSESRKEARLAKKEARRKQREQSAQMHDYIYHKMTAESPTVTADGVQVVGFGFIVLAILSAIISWVVQRILTHYWNEYNK